MRLSSIRNWFLLAACFPAHAAPVPSITSARYAFQDQTDRQHGTTEFIYLCSVQAASGGAAPRMSANVGLAEPASIAADYGRGPFAQKHHRFRRHRRHNATSDRASDAASDAKT